MKKLLFLTAVTMLLASAGGCQCFQKAYRGSAYPAGAAVCDPCAPAAPACDPCGGAPGAVMPGPTTTYVPGPVN